jgi:hypothetical protein
VTRVFPALVIVLFVAAALESAWRWDGHLFVFYAASAAINYVVAY